MWPRRQRNEFAFARHGVEAPIFEQRQRLIEVSGVHQFAIMPIGPVRRFQNFGDRFTQQVFIAGGILNEKQLDNLGVSHSPTTVAARFGFSQQITGKFSTCCTISLSETMH